MDLFVQRIEEPNLEPKSLREFAEECGLTLCLEELRHGGKQWGALLSNLMAKEPMILDGFLGFGDTLHARSFARTLSRRAGISQSATARRIATQPR